MKTTITALITLFLSTSSYAWEPLPPQKQPLTTEEFIKLSKKDEQITEKNNRKLAQTCQKLRTKIKKQLQKLTGKDLINDNNKLLKANLLTSAHGQNGCNTNQLTDILQRIKL